jgi:hypothetical protein
LNFLLRLLSSSPSAAATAIAKEAATAIATEAAAIYQQRLEAVVATTATTAINSRSWR